MSLSLHLHSMVVLVQAAVPPSQPPASVGIQGMSSKPEDHLAIAQALITQMQTTINALAVIVTVITGIAALLGVAFTAAGFSEQRRAREEIRQAREEIRQVRQDSAKEITDRHQTHRDEMKLHKDEMTLLYAGLDAKVREATSAVLKQYEEQVEHTYSTVISHTLETIESIYASNLRQIEDILITFQEECYTASDGQRVFDFTKYNTFRHLLIRLISGGRSDVLSGLSRILEVYVPQIGESTAVLLRILIDAMVKAGRLNRTEQRRLAGDILRELDRRFPPPGPDDEPDPT
jgi:hypothetical protein